MHSIVSGALAKTKNCTFSVDFCFKLFTLEYWQGSSGPLPIMIYSSSIVGGNA